jgi:MFS transporter, DHA2 family, multidrug resistance protein
MAISLPDPKSTPADGGLPLPQRHWAVVAISLNTLMVVIDQAILTVALPTAARALSVTQSEVISLVAVSQIVSLIALLPFAAWGDRIGHTRLFRGGQALFVAGSLACMVAPTLPTLLVARGIQAIGAAALLSVGVALLRAIYPAKMLGKGLGINGVLIAVGAAIAPSLGGLVVATIGWRWVFVCALPLAIGSLLFGRWLPKATTLHPDYDWQGALQYAVTAGLIAAAFSTFAYGGTAVASASLFAAAMGIGTMFVRREMGRARPILPVDLLAKPVFALSVGAAFAAFMGGTTMLLTMPFLLESILGPHPAEIGAVMMAWPGAMIISAPLAGALADRMPGGSLSALGMALACAGFVLIANAPVDASHLVLAPRIALCGFGMGFFISPNSRLLIGATPPARTASVGGLISTTRILGQSSGAALVALLMQPWLDRGDSAPMIAAGLALVAGLLSAANMLPKVSRARSVRQHVELPFSDDDVP